MRLFLISFLLLSILVAPLAQSIELNDQQTRIAQDVFANTMSPYCPGRLLQDCPSTAASELKEKIRVKVAAGESLQSIDAYLFEVYGETIKASPDASGFGLTAWITPFLFLIVGAAMIIFWLKSNLKKAKVGTSTKLSKIDSSWDKKIDQELS